MSVRLLAAAAMAAALPGAAYAQGIGPIETAQLGRLDAWTVSALARGEGALGASLWQNSDPAFLVTLFDKLPSNYESPAVRGLARRVLLTGGTAPPGAAEQAAQGRFRALERMGEADELAVMAAGAASGISDPLIAEFAAKAELARGARPMACQRGRTSVADQPPEFLLHLRAYCATVAGDRAASDLALELARAGGANNSWIGPALGAAGGTAAGRAPGAKYDDSLTTAISIAGNLRPAAGSISAAPTLALVTLARSAEANPLFRAQAAAAAYRRGAISAAEARELLRAAPQDPSAPQIAATLRAVEAAPGSLEAATAIAGALQRATAPADFTATAQLFKDDIAALTAAPDPAATLAFIRAALAAGDLALAQRLAGSARAAGVDTMASAPIDSALAIAQGASGEAALAALRHRVSGASGAAARSAARDATIFIALGAPQDGATQNFLLANPPQGGARADAALLVELGAAVVRQAQGEAALLAAIAAGDGPGKLDADSLAQILRALRAVGLEADARALAVEALLAGQPS